MSYNSLGLTLAFGIVRYREKKIRLTFMFKYLNLYVNYNLEFSTY